MVDREYSDAQKAIDVNHRGNFSLNKPTPPSTNPDVFPEGSRGILSEWDGRGGVWGFPLQEKGKKAGVTDVPEILMQVSSSPVKKHQARRKSEVRKECEGVHVHARTEPAGMQVWAECFWEQGRRWTKVSFGCCVDLPQLANHHLAHI